jgi:replicative DNA helicase
MKRRQGLTRVNTSSIIQFPQRDENDRPFAKERLTPQSLEAEQSTLGAMLLERDAVARGVEVLSRDDFYRENHRLIFAAIASLFDKGEPIDLVTVSEDLRNRGQLDKAGGAAYIGVLIESCPSSANIDAYARVVSEKSLLRRLISTCDQIASTAYGDVEDVSLTIDAAEKMMFDVGSRRIKDGFSHIKPLLMQAYDQIERQFQHRGEATGISTGFYDLDEITSGLQPTDLIIVAARPSMGKCLANHCTIVNTETGALQTIEECVQQKMPQVANLSRSGQLQTSPVADWIDSGVKPTMRVVTRLGREVEVTGHHPFLTVRGWVPLHDLKVGDYIAVPRSMPIFGKDESHSRAQVRLLAYLIAEGGLTGNSVRFTNTDPAIIADYKACVASVFPGYEARRNGQRITYTIVNAQNKHARNPAVTWLREIGLMGQGAKEKHFPAFAWTWSKAHLAEFLRVLFSCDGTIYKLGNYPRIEFTVASPQLAADVQHALLRFGIVAKRWAKRAKCNGKYFESWRVEITDPASVLRYQAEIGWVGEKSGRFTQDIFAARALPKRASNAGHPPRAVWDLVRAACKKQGLSLNELARRAGETTSQGKFGGWNAHAGRSLPAHRLRAYAEVLQDINLFRVSSPDIYWDEIVSIEDAGEQQVYDLTVPDGSNFIAQDVCVHNTALCLNIAHHIALHDKMPVAVFSLEMSKDQLVQRLICSEAEINSRDLRRGFLQDQDWHRVTNAVNNLYQAPIFIDDQPGQSTFEMRAKARRLAAEHGQLGLVVIDYLQLAEHAGKSDNNAHKYSEIVRSFKSMARELKCPLIALSQLSREVEKREDKRPILSDLRDSGSIEAEADVVALIYRPSYYKNKMFKKNGERDRGRGGGDGLPDEPDPDEGIAEVIIGKQRNGPTGTVRLGFQPDFARFTNLSQDPYNDGY